MDLGPLANVPQRPLSACTDDDAELGVSPLVDIPAGSYSSSVLPYIFKLTSLVYSCLRTSGSQVTRTVDWINATLTLQHRISQAYSPIRHIANPYLFLCSVVTNLASHLQAVTCRMNRDFSQLLIVVTCTSERRITGGPSAL